MNTETPLLGKVALVTGGARRIGAAICRELAARGATVAVHYHHSEVEAIAQTRVLGHGVFALRGDVATPEGCDAIFQEVMEWTGRLDILVNNAAVFEPDQAAADVLSCMYAVNVTAPLHLSARLFENRREACILHLLDQRIVSAPQEDGNFSAYVASKRELAASVGRLAKEYGPFLRVNGVSPGAVLAPEQVREPAGPRILGPRPTCEDVADAVGFLARASSITGQIL
ncbi:MAG: SDR family NAD(P)-dependent oxidoreductase, partial [Verrucomicrobiota bacterium]|nr:SDR family NAD(P)-dependent oxidoreductase [Verrucomicrobiota bacterium]